jgi:uncharacterized iron-regulated membrane protein
VFNPKLQRRKRFEISDQRFLVYWHFWIGILIAPVLLLMSLTGGILLFEDELLLRLLPHPNAETDSLGQRFTQRLEADYYDQLLPIVESQLGPDAIVWRVELENHQGRLPRVFVASRSKPWPQKRYYVDPNTGEFFPPLAKVDPYDQNTNSYDTEDGDLFRSTTLFHRTLYMGWFGRLLVEFSATWLIASTLLGVLLWFRSRKSRAEKMVSSDAGSIYLKLRHWHSTAGILSAIAIVTIAWNGLHYSELYGTLYHGIARASGQYDYLLDVPKGTLAGQVELTPLELGKALRSAKASGLLWQRISIQRLAASSGALMIESGGDFPPSMTQTLYLDAQDHSILKRYDYQDLGWMARWNKWSYSLHTGSFGGVVTKLLWLIVLLMTAFLPLSACAMSLARRRKQLLAAGQPVSFSSILPSRAIPEHRWVWLVVAAVGIVFPLIGLLALAIACATWLLNPPRVSGG